MEHDDFYMQFYTDMRNLRRRNHAKIGHTNVYLDLLRDRGVGRLFRRDAYKVRFKDVRRLINLHEKRDMQASCTFRTCLTLTKIFYLISCLSHAFSHDLSEGTAAN